MLHAVFVVETFLENLIKRHCQFNIAFFEGKLLPCGESWNFDLTFGYPAIKNELILTT